MSTERRTADLSAARRLLAQNSVVGVDGGGTKTEAVIMDANQRVIGEGRAGPSNPLRVGIAGAAAAVREAIEQRDWKEAGEQIKVVAQIIRNFAAEIDKATKIAK